MLTDALDLRAHVGVEVVQRPKRQVHIGPGRHGQLGADLVVLEGERAAAGVPDDDDLLGAQEVLADDERADGVVTGEPAGVADDVCVTGAQAEDQ